MSFVHPDSQEMSDPNPVPKLVGARNVYSLGIKRAFRLLRDVKMTRSMMNEVFCACWVLQEGNCFCLSFDGSKFSPINTSSINVIHIAHSFTLSYDTFDWSTDAKSKLKFGVVSVTMEQQVIICDGETAYRGLAARRSIDVGQVCCVSSLDR